MKRCLLLLVALATMPSTYALPPGEFPLAPLPKGPAPYERRRPEVAANQNGFLTVWEDARVTPGQPRIWAARVSRDGALLDPTGIRVATMAAGSTLGTHFRSVATDGTDFLIAWVDQNRLGLAKVAGDGTLIPLPDPAMAAGDASIVWIGDVYAVFVNDGGTIKVATVGRDGRVITRSVVGLNTVSTFSTATNDDKTLVYIGWLQGGDNSLRVAPIPSFQIRGGAISPPVVFEPTGSNGFPSQIDIGSNAGVVLAVWIDTEPNPHVYRAQVLEGNGFAIGPVITLGDASASSVPPTVVWNGSEYVVTYKGLDEAARFVRIAPDSTILGAPTIISANVADVTIGTTGDDSLVVWIEQRGSFMPLYADILNSGQSLLALPAPLLVSVSFADRSDAVVAWRGTHYLGVWRDLTDVSRAVVGRFSADGVPLDGTGVSINSGLAASPPVMASNGSTAVVAWLDLDGVSSSFVDQAGGASRRAFGFPGGLPAVNWNGQQYLVAWRSPNGLLLALRITGAGATIDGQAVIVGPVSSAPFIGWTGNSYVVVYREEAICPPLCGTFSLWAQFVSAGLTPIGSPIKLSDDQVAPPVLADGPSGTLVVWPRTVGGSTTLRGVRILNGAVLDPLNGFEIGAATYATVYASPAGWGVVSGPYLWAISKNGAVTPRTLAFPFVPLGARSTVVLGGPAPLVVYRREPVGAEQMMQVVARYVTGPARHRVVRH
jgi:hypothetical protein